MKSPDKAGLDEVFSLTHSRIIQVLIQRYCQIEEKYNGSTIDKNEYYQADPTGVRCGNGVGPQLTATFEQVACDAEAVIGKVQTH